MVEEGGEGDPGVEVGVEGVTAGGGGVEVDFGVGEVPEFLGMLQVGMRWVGTSEPRTEGVGICPLTGEDEEQSDESAEQVWANIRPIQTVNSNSWQNVRVQTARGRGNAVWVVAPGTAAYMPPTEVSLRSKTLNSRIALTGQKSKRTDIITPTSPVVPAILITRLPMVIVRAGRSGENLRENNENEERIHSPEYGGSHLV